MFHVHKTEFIIVLKINRVVGLNWLLNEGLNEKAGDEEGEEEEEEGEEEEEEEEQVTEYSLTVLFKNFPNSTMFLLMFE